MNPPVPTVTGCLYVIVAPSGVGGSVVSVPINADVGLGATARQSLQQVFAAGGIDATSSAIESLLLVTINFSAQNDPTQLAQFLTPYQTLTVALAANVPANAGSFLNTGAPVRARFPLEQPLIPYGARRGTIGRHTAPKHSTPAEHHAEIVRWHRNSFRPHEPILTGQRGDFVEVAYAPGGVPRP